MILTILLAYAIMEILCWLNEVAVFLLFPSVPPTRYSFKSGTYNCNTHIVENTYNLLNEGLNTQHKLQSVRVYEYLSVSFMMQINSHEAEC